MNEPQLTYPLDEQSKKIIEKTVDGFLEQKVFDLIWKKTFHWLEIFDSLDGCHVVADASTIDYNNIAISTSDVNNNVAYVEKTPSWQGLITFAQGSNMRSGFVVSSVANATSYILVGTTTTGSYYGFKIVNDSLKGVSFDGTTEKTIDLMTIEASVEYQIEARYAPADKIIFLVNAVERGTIIENLPSRLEVVNVYPLHFSIKTTTTAVKTLQFSFWEYLQSRNILR